MHPLKHSNSLGIYIGHFPLHSTPQNGGMALMRRNDDPRKNPEQILLLRILPIDIYNQSLVASLIAAKGAEKTQAWAAGLVANLARPPKGGDRAQIEAAATGQCVIAVAKNRLDVQRLKRSTGRYSADRPFIWRENHRFRLFRAMWSATSSRPGKRRRSVSGVNRTLMRPLRDAKSPKKKGPALARQAMEVTHGAMNAGKRPGPRHLGSVH